MEAFFENFHQKWKNASVRALFRLTSKSSNKKSFYTFEDIVLRKSHTKLHRKLSETLGPDLILKVRNQYLLSSSEISLISAIFFTVFVYRNEKYIY